MEIWNKHTPQQVLKSMEMEIAKAQNEIRCAKKDVEKASNRLAFCLSAVHNLKDRLDKDEQEKDMKLSELAKTPQLQKLTINNEKLVEKYGDELEFFIYDRQPLDIFTKLADVSQDNVGEYINILKDIILNEEGNPIMVDGATLPIDVMTEALKLIGENLGK